MAAVSLLLPTVGHCHGCGADRSVAFIRASQQRVCGKCLQRHLGHHLHYHRHHNGSDGGAKRVGGPLDGVGGGGFSDFDFDDDYDNFTPLGIDGQPIVIPTALPSSSSSSGQQQQQYSMAMPPDVQEFRNMPRINFQWQTVAALMRPLYLLRTQGYKNHYETAVGQIGASMRDIFASRPGSFDTDTWLQFTIGVSRIVFHTASDRVQARMLALRQREPHCEDTVQSEYVTQHIPQVQQIMDALITKNDGYVPLGLLAAQFVGMYEFFRAAKEGSWDAAKQEFEQVVAMIATTLVYWSIDDQLVDTIVYTMFSQDVLGPRVDRILTEPAPRLPSLAEEAAAEAAAAGAATGRGRGRRYTPNFLLESKLVGCRHQTRYIDPAFEYTELGRGNVVAAYRERLVIDAIGHYVYDVGQPPSFAGRKGYVSGELLPEDKAAFDALWERYARRYRPTTFNDTQDSTKPFIRVHSAGRQSLEDDLLGGYERAYDAWSAFGARVIARAREALPVRTPTRHAEPIVHEDGRDNLQASE